MPTLSSLLDSTFQGDVGPSSATITVANDTTTNPLYPVLVGAAANDQSPKVSTTKLSFNASTGALTADSFIKSGGTSTQFLKADGSIDSNTYLTTVHPEVTLNSSLTDILSLSTQALSAVDAGAADAIVGWDDSLSKLTYLSAADVRTAINVDVAGTDNSTDLTLAASSQVLFSLNGQELQLDSQTANTFFAAPNGAPGAPTFRTLVAADIPDLSVDYETAGAVASHESTYNHSNFLTAVAVTYENLNANGDVGTGATQVAYQVAMKYRVQWLHMRAPTITVHL